MKWNRSCFCQRTVVGAREANRYILLAIEGLRSEVNLLQQANTVRIARRDESPLLSEFLKELLAVRIALFLV